MGAAVRLYGLEQVGVWVLGTTISSYLALLDLGASSALPRSLPRLLQSDRDKGARLVSCTVFLTLFVAGVALVLLAQLGGSLANVLLDVRNNTAVQQKVFAVVIVSAILSIPLRVGYGLLASESRFDIYFGIDLMAQIVRVGLVTLVVARLRLDIVIFAFAATSPVLIGNVLQYVVGLRRSKIKVSLSRSLLHDIRELVSHAGASLLLTLSTMLLIQGSTLSATPLGTASVAAVAIPLMLVTQAMSFTGAAGALVTPIASTLSAKEYGKLGGMTRSSIAVSASVSTPLVLLLFFAGPILLRLWLGAGGANGQAFGQLMHVLQLLIIGAFFIGPAAAARGVLMGIGRHWHGALAEFVSSALGLLFGVALVKVLGLGVFGIALGVAFGFFLRCIVLIALLVRCIAVEPKALWGAVVKPFALLLASFVPPVFWLGTFEPSTIWQQAVVSIAIAWLTWGSASWVFLLNQRQRELIASWIRQHLPR